ncbi:MAG: DUF1189 family protein [Candidatus Liptonbacteria bacterium]|nr:DUF1189 family protein [Candidatus Liptonbacteria bacterium]
MDFLDNIKKSIYGPEFYKELQSKSLSFSFKYFYALASVLAVIATAQFSFQAIPSVTAFLAGLGPEIVNSYPNELVITIKNGQASSNVAEPYFIKTPESIRNENYRNVPATENFVVIDTKNQFTEENFTKYNSFAVVTKTSLAFRKDNGGIEIKSLKEMPDWTIDRASVASFVGKIQPFIKFSGPFFVLISFIGFMLFFSAELIYLLFAALLIWIIAKIKKLPLGYKKSYQAGLHIMTLPLLFGVVSTLLNIHISIPFFTTIVVVVVALINFEPRKTEPTAS